VVELKAEGIQLTDDDAAQAISYALLLRQRPPIVLVTNGQESHLYDVWSGELVDGTQASVDGLYRTVPDADYLRRREEALALFLSVSPENLLTFCREQSLGGMRGLLGSSDAKDRKYIPELFVSRGDLRETVDEFIGSPAPLFVLSGDAGTGKTCELCALTEKLLAGEEPVLFYRGAALGQSRLLDAIAEDFDWTFAESESARDTIRRLNKALGERALVVVIDAVDEWASSKRVQELLLAAQRLNGSRVKLLVSCKTLAWTEFKMQRGVPMGFEKFLFRGEPQALHPMDRVELSSAIDRYSNFYGVHGAFESRAIEAARESPFLLRVLFEVAASRGDEHVFFSSLEFFDKYFQQLTERLSDSEGASYALRLAARLLFAANAERVSRDELFREGRFDNRQATLRELEQFGVLERSGSVRDESVRFYFSLLRDYIIAFQVCRWNDVDESSLRRALEDSAQGGVRLEAMTFFYRYCEPGKQKVLAGDLADLAREYLHFYREVLTSQFCRLRSSFSPFTDGDIGFVGELIMSDLYMGRFGFRKIRPGEPEVLIVPVPRYENTNLLHLYGVERARGIGRFEAINVRETILEYEVGRHLRQLVDDGFLDEAVAPELASEVIGCAVARERLIFSDTRSSQSTGPLFPVEIRSVRRWWRFELLAGYYWHQRAETRRSELGLTDRGVSSSDFTAEDYEWIRDATERNLDQPDQVVRSWTQPERNNQLSKLDRQLSRAVATLEAAGIETVGEHPILPPDTADARIWMANLDYYRENTCRYIEKLLSLAFPLAVRLIEHNFPAQAQEFPSIKVGPFVGVVTIRFGLKHGPYGTLYLCEPDVGAQRTVFLARDAELVQTRMDRDPDFSFNVCCDSVWRRRIDTEVVGQRSVGIRSWLRPWHDYLGFRGSFSGTGQAQPVIRAAVYDWIRKDLAHVFQGISERYGQTADLGTWERFAQSRNG
jgi:hypothetical protein